MPGLVRETEPRESRMRKYERKARGPLCDMRWRSAALGCRQQEPTFVTYASRSCEINVVEGSQRVSTVAVDSTDNCLDRLPTESLGRIRSSGRNAGLQSRRRCWQAILLVLAVLCHLLPRGTALQAPGGVESVDQTKDSQKETQLAGASFPNTQAMGRLADLVSASSNFETATQGVDSTETSNLPASQQGPDEYPLTPVEDLDLNPQLKQDANLLDEMSPRKEWLAGQIDRLLQATSAVKVRARAKRLKAEIADLRRNYLINKKLIEVNSKPVVPGAAHCGMGYNIFTGESTTKLLHWTPSMFAHENLIGPAWRLYRVPFGLDTRRMHSSLMESSTIKLVRSATEYTTVKADSISTQNLEGFLVESQELIGMHHAIMQGLYIAVDRRIVNNLEVSVAVPPGVETTESVEMYKDFGAAYRDKTLSRLSLGHTPDDISPKEHSENMWQPSTIVYNDHQREYNGLSFVTSDLRDAVCGGPFGSHIPSSLPDCTFLTESLLTGDPDFDHLQPGEEYFQPRSLAETMEATSEGDEILHCHFSHIQSINKFFQRFGTHWVRSVQLGGQLEQRFTMPAVELEQAVRQFDFDVLSTTVQKVVTDFRRNRLAPSSDLGSPSDADLELDTADQVPRYLEDQLRAETKHQLFDAAGLNPGASLSPITSGALSQQQKHGERRRRLLADVRGSRSDKLAFAHNRQTDSMSEKVITASSVVSGGRLDGEQIDAEISDRNFHEWVHTLVDDPAVTSQSLEPIQHWLSSHPDIVQSCMADNVGVVLNTFSTCDDLTLEQCPFLLDFSRNDAIGEAYTATELKDAEQKNAGGGSAGLVEILKKTKAVTNIAIKEGGETIDIEDSNRPSVCAFWTGDKHIPEFAAAASVSRSSTSAAEDRLFHPVHKNQLRKLSRGRLVTLICSFAYLSDRMKPADYRNPELTAFGLPMKRYGKKKEKLRVRKLPKGMPPDFVFIDGYVHGITRNANAVVYHIVFKNAPSQFPRKNPARRRLDRQEIMLNNAVRYHRHKATKFSEVMLTRMLKEMSAQRYYLLAVQNVREFIRDAKVILGERHHQPVAHGVGQIWAHLKNLLEQDKGPRTMQRLFHHSSKYYLNTQMFNTECQNSCQLDVDLFRRRSMLMGEVDMDAAVRMEGQIDKIQRRREEIDKQESEGVGTRRRRLLMDTSTATSQKEGKPAPAAGAGQKGNEKQDEKKKKDEYLYEVRDDLRPIKPEHYPEADKLRAEAQAQAHAVSSLLVYLKRKRMQVKAQEEGDEEKAKSIDVPEDPEVTINGKVEKDASKIAYELFNRASMDTLYQMETSDAEDSSGKISMVPSPEIWTSSMTSGSRRQHTMCVKRCEDKAKRLRRTQYLVHSQADLILKHMFFGIQDKMCRICVGVLESDLTPGRAAKPDPFFHGVASPARAYCEERSTRVDIEMCLEIVEVLRERLVAAANVRHWVRLDERYSLAYFVKYLFKSNPQWQGYNSHLDPSTGEPWRMVKLADTVCQRLLDCDPYEPLTLAVADRFSTAAITTSGEIADLERSLFREMQQPVKSQDAGQIQRYWAELKSKYRDEWCQQYQASLWNLRKQHENQWNDFMGEMCSVCVTFEERMYSLIEMARSRWEADELVSEAGKKDKTAGEESGAPKVPDVSLLDALMHDRFGLKLSDELVCANSNSGKGEYTAKELRKDEQKLEELLTGKPMKNQEGMAKTAAKIMGKEPAPVLLEERASGGASLLRGQRTPKPKPSTITPDMTRMNVMKEGVTCPNLGMYEQVDTDIGIVKKLQVSARREIVLSKKECLSAVKALQAMIKRKAILLNSILQQSLVYQQEELPMEFFFALFTEWHNRAFSKGMVNMNEVKNPSLLAEYGPAKQDMCVEFRYCTAHRARITRQAQKLENPNIAPLDPVVDKKTEFIPFDDPSPVLARLGSSAKERYSKTRFKEVATGSAKPFVAGVAAPEASAASFDESVEDKTLKSAAAGISRTAKEDSKDVVQTMADLQAELAQTLGS